MSDEAMAAFAWMLGEYGSRVENACYIIEDLIQKTKSRQFLIEAMNALTKLLFVTPGESKVILGRLLHSCIKSEDPLLKARANLIYSMIKSSLQITKTAIFQSKKIEQFTNGDDSELIDVLFDEFNTFSAVFMKPSSKWHKEDGEFEEIEEDGEEEEPHRLEEAIWISADDYNTAWTAGGLATIEDSVSLGYSLDLEAFSEVLSLSNVGVAARGVTEEGSKIFAYGLINESIALIQTIEKDGEMSFQTKVATDESTEEFRDFWLGFFDE